VAAKHGEGSVANNNANWRNGVMASKQRRKPKWRWRRKKKKAEIGKPSAANQPGKQWLAWQSALAAASAK